MKKTLIFNGEVITVNKNNEIAEAVLIEDNKIVYVGTTEEAFTLCGENTDKIDAEGKTVLPGFIETHIHIASKAVLSKGIDFSKKSGINNIKDLQNRIKNNSKNLKTGEWMIGHGFTFEDLEEKRWPTRWELDEVCPEIPVAITHSSAHTGLYNTKAFALCHLLDGQVAYPKEDIGMDKNGILNGVLKESAHFMFSDVVSKFNPISEEDMKNHILITNSQMNEAGITSAHDAGATGTTTLNAIQKLAEEGKLTCRMYPMIFSLLGKKNNMELVNAQILTGFHTGLGNEYIKIGPLKLMIDGSGASGTCATREPMSHNGQIMPTSMTKEEVEDIVVRAHKAGFQITAHCIGDRAVEMILNAYDKAQQEYPREDCRHRIEHCMIAEPDLLARIKEQKVIPVFNPAFINLWGTSFNKYYQGKRNSYLIALRSAIDKGIIGTIASDWECIPDIRPMQGIASAMDRTVYETGETVAKNQAISLLEAIKCYTYNAAYASFDEKIKGSLEVGKLADLIVLDGKITEKSPKEISEMNVEKTFFNGKIVYKNK